MIIRIDYEIFENTQNDPSEDISNTIICFKIYRHDGIMNMSIKKPINPITTICHNIQTWLSICATLVTTHQIYHTT